MGRLDDLIAQVSSERLRKELHDALSQLKRKQRFGLVFEEHIPETTALFGRAVKPGSIVQRRDDPTAKVLHRVVDLVDGGQRAKIEPVEGGPSALVRTRDLLVIKRFGDPIYPALTSLGRLARGPETRPYHAVIKGENYHVLQLLLYLFEGRVDCIYVDPPYNTGARDWKYSNRYVDSTDAWRHSKWLSFMEKRLKLARRLLRPDGVLIVTIDEHEVHHLGMLLERLFPEYLRYMVTIVNNPKGTFKANFGRVDEQAFFVVPDTGSDVIVPKPVAEAEPEDEGDAEFIRRLLRLVPGGAAAALSEGLEWDETEVERLSAFLQEEEASQQESEANGEAASGSIASPPAGEDRDDFEDWFLRRRGQESSYRHQRPNQFYAILVNEQTRQVVGIGPALSATDSWTITRDGDVVTVYPVDDTGNERVWRYSRETMQRYIDAGEIVVGKYNGKTSTWTLNHRKRRKESRRLKTVWWDKRHDAGVHGTNVVNAFLGRRGLFPFPKSVYAVQDAIAAVVRNRPNALIVDFFAGSGTTLHATCLLNAADGGQRTSVLVTNNEVDERTARELNGVGHFPGDPEFEARGIFEQVMRPRCEAVITGRRPNGTPVPGRHVGGRLYRAGFEENVEFFRLDYLDPEQVELGRQLEAILPSLWLAAGALGPREVPPFSAGFSLPVGSTYGLLLRESRFSRFKRALERRPDVTHVWLVTDSEEAYAEMCAALPARLSVSMLYRDYLRNFQINTERTR